MVVPVSPTLPDSTLSPAQVKQKFHSSAMAGLGCINYDPDAMECLDDAPPGTFLPFTGSSTWDTDPLTGQPFDNSAPYLVDAYMTSGGMMIAIMSDGTQHTMSQSGQFGIGSGSYPRQAGTVTPQQASAWPALIQSLINAGVRVGTVANLPAGASLTPNGTIVGSGQSLIRPGVITSNSLTSALSTLTSSPMLMIGGFGLLAILLLSSGGRR